MKDARIAIAILNLAGMSTSAGEAAFRAVLGAEEYQEVPWGGDVILHWYSHCEICPECGAEMEFTFDEADDLSPAGWCSNPECHVVCD